MFKNCLRNILFFYLSYYVLFYIFALSILKNNIMKHLSKVEKRVLRSVERGFVRFERLMRSNLSRKRDTAVIDELRSKYNLIEFVL